MRRLGGLAALAAACALAAALCACSTRQLVRGLDAYGCSSGGGRSCIRPPGRDAIAASRPEVSRILAGARTQDELTAFVGVPARICVRSPPSARVCEWRLEYREGRWSDLAATLPTDDSINLLCQLPADDREREPDACTAFPRRSNRFLYELPYSRTPSRNGERRPDAAEVRARYQQEASAEIARARTVEELSHLMGAAPNACEDLEDAAQGCVWRAANATYGHGTLAFSISAATREKIQMRCILPDDGSPRASGSCELEVPGRADHRGAR
jgi:hypothetical protein